MRHHHRIHHGAVLAVIFAVAVLLATPGPQLPGPTTVEAQVGARKVSGTVVSAVTQQPVPNANVRYEESGMPDQTTTTNSKGYFELPAGRLGVVEVKAATYGTARRRWPPRTGSSQLEVELLPPAIVSGTVVDMVTGQPLPSKVRVVVRHPSNYVSHGVKADRGTFELKDLPPGSGLLVASSEGYAPTVGSITAEGGKVRDARVGLLLEAQAAGRVVNGAGEPVPWAYVRTAYPDMSVGGIIESLRGGSPWTDAEGNFAIDGLVPDTTIELQAQLNGQMSSVETIVVGPGMRRNGIELRLGGAASAAPIGAFNAAFADTAASSRKCLKLATWHNQRRRVGRPVNVECEGLHARDDHRGNWGLDSWVSDPMDGFQFPGWDRRDGWLTWQSCTDEYPPPDPEHYNNPQYPAYTTQIAVPDDDKAYGYDVDRGPAGATCESINQGVYTFINEYMALYELDSPDDDDHVGTLYFGTVSVPVECNDPWDCSGASSWRWPNQPGSADNVEADHQIRVFLF